MAFFDIVPVGNARKLKKLTRESKRISGNQTNLSLAYNNLTSVSKQINETIVSLKERDFSKHRALIESLDLEDSYKKNLVTELDSSRTKSIETLTPLKDKAEKLRANMIVTQEKSLQYLAIIKAQTEVAKAGEIQVAMLSSLQEMGEELDNRIDNLLEECERINQVTEGAIAPFRAGGMRNLGGLIGHNPIVAGAVVEEKTLT